jgi:hypothetical protein
MAYNVVASRFEIDLMFNDSNDQPWIGKLQTLLLKKAKDVVGDFIAVSSSLFPSHGCFECGIAPPPFLIGVGKPRAPIT